MTEREIAALAASGAVAGLAPTTEADLGDGTFPGPAYSARGGRFGVGSDSNTVISPFAELRQLEWSQRLRAPPQRAGDGRPRRSGTSLWARAARGGAQAVAQPPARSPPARAPISWCSTRDDPALAKQAPDDSARCRDLRPGRAPVRDVMAGGRFIVRDGRQRARTPYSRAIAHARAAGA